MAMTDRWADKQKKKEKRGNSPPPPRGAATAPTPPPPPNRSNCTAVYALHVKRSCLYDRCGLVYWRRSSLLHPFIKFTFNHKNYVSLFFTHCILLAIYETSMTVIRWFVTSVTLDTLLYCVDTCAVKLDIKFVIVGGYATIHANACNRYRFRYLDQMYQFNIKRMKTKSNVRKKYKYNLAGGSVMVLFNVLFHEFAGR